MENNKDIVTVAMPVYNVEKYVAEAVWSVLNQTIDNIELLIIDDCGSDHSMDIVKAIIGDYHGCKSVRIIKHDVNKGLSEARNTAIRVAKGKYIFFIDSDDKITENCIETLYQVMILEDVDFVISSHAHIDEFGNILNQHFFDERKVINESSKIKEFIFQLFDNHCIIPAWNKLFRLDFLRNNNISFIPKIYYEDVLFSLNTYMKAFSCAFISDVTYLYRQREGSIMHVGNGAFIEKEIKDNSYVYKTTKDYLRNFSSCEHFEDAFFYYAKQSFFFLKAYKRHNYNHINIKSYVKDMLYYPLSIKEILSFKRKKIKHLFFWTLGKLPYSIIKHMI